MDSSGFVCVSFSFWVFRRETNPQHCGEQHFLPHPDGETRERERERKCERERKRERENMRERVRVRERVRERE
jgi:hypothetical protein